MADIYIAYASENRDVAKELHDRLSSQWDIWWDDNIVGNFAEVIEKEIEKATCILPLFSYNSRVKDTFTDELRLGKKHKKEILPVQLDDSDPPYSFGGLSRVNLKSWKGEEDHAGFLQLKRKLAKVVDMKHAPKRPVCISNGKIPLPTLFLSVSSYNTRLEPVDAVKILSLFNTPAILVSAYDLVLSDNHETKTIINDLKEYRNNGGFVLIDSGNYEASRLSDEKWNSEQLKEILTFTPHDWVFCFDKVDEKTQMPSPDKKKSIRQVVDSVKQAQEFTSNPVLPVVHSVKKSKGAGYHLRDLPQVIKEVSEQLKPQLIAVPERELGAGLLDRAKMVQTIREELNQLPFYQPLHILGTGDPWSITILAAAGADTFDGLEWCRMVVDGSSNRLHHYQHYDFFSYQTSMTNYPVVKEALKNKNETGFESLVAFHNLDYFANLMSQLRDYAMKDNMETLITRIIGNEAADELKQQVSGIFK